MSSGFNKSSQISESILLGVILSFSGGFMDAYTYVSRGQVFANAQTGNILLLGIHLSEGNWPIALRYFLPIIAFIIGIGISDMVRYFYKKNEQVIHWRQITILIEAIIFIPVGFLPQSYNLLANSLISFACGIQVESFRKIQGTGIATTMCIGNLRAATESFSQFVVQRHSEDMKKTMLFMGVIIVFVIGAILGNICVGLWKENAIFVSSLLLFLGFLLMFIKHEDNVFSMT
jgi:uncharacterized membrane protein YoaK (UPF0700 family)